VAAWEGEGSPHAEGDEAITHQVVDRPTQGHKFLSRAYVQPQWVVDSANARLLLPVDLYAPGRPPPPHLSPFVDYDKEGYMPDWARTVQQLQVGGRGQRGTACTDNCLPSVWQSPQLFWACTLAPPSQW
jgi:pescadillo protein